MNILMINGTMRKSSTYRLAKMFVERVTLSQDMVIELFLPKDMPEFCRGCGRCITQGAKKCPDYLIYLKRITRLIDEADLLVFTTPVYVYHATGQMKALLDHYGYRWMVHRPEASMFKKQAVCFSTAAGAGMKSALKDITDSLKWWGVGRIYTYGVAVRSMDWDEISKPIKDKIDENVNRLMAKIIHDREKVTPSLYARVLFYAMRYMHSRTFMQQIDTDYWREARGSPGVRSILVCRGLPKDMGIPMCRVLPGGTDSQVCPLPKIMARQICRNSPGNLYRQICRNSLEVTGSQTCRASTQLMYRQGGRMHIRVKNFQRCRISRRPKRRGRRSNMQKYA